MERSSNGGRREDIISEAVGFEIQSTIHDPENNLCGEICF